MYYLLHMIQLGGYPASILDQLVTRIGLSNFQCDMNMITHSSILCLVSVFFTYLNLLHSHLKGNKRLIVTDKHHKCRRLPSSTLQLFRFTHTSAGGVTGFECLYTSPNIQSYSPPTIIMQRVMGDTLDY